MVSMDFTYKGLKGKSSKRITRAAVFAILSALFFFAAIMMLEDIRDLNLYLFVVGMAILTAVGAYTEFFWNVSYAIKEEGLTITRPILHRKVFPYAEIHEAKQVSAKEAREILTERWNKIHNDDLVEKTLSSPLGDTKTRYERPKTSEETIDDMKLKMSGNYSSLPIRFGQSKTRKIAPWKLHLEVPESTYICLSVEEGGLGRMNYLLSPEKPNEFLSRLKKRIKNKPKN